MRGAFAAGFEACAPEVVGETNLGTVLLGLEGRDGFATPCGLRYPVLVLMTSG